ncbi:MAG: tripartite tricarboxylate transporter TctB family protein [Burkholderiales bacterium]
MRRAIHWPDFGAALAVLAIGIGFLLWAKTYPPQAAAVPTLVAWLTIVLALIDAVARTETALGRALRRVVSAEQVIEWQAEGDGEAGARRVASSVFWVLAYLAGVALAGFLLATPAYILLYMKLHGGRSALAGALAAAGTTAGIWLIFELAFRYPLYPGLLIGGY